MDITGRKLFVKALEEEGVDTIFGYPGGTVTDLFDELYKTDSINLILPRHEQGLIHEAEGYAKSTGRVGVCLVTSGPGATNIITGLADAHYDSIPLVCFTGQVPLGLIGNDAFQEVDIVGMTRSITKYGVTVRRREDLGKLIKMAFYIAQTGKPGPVLIDIPKDIQTAAGPAEYEFGAGRRLLEVVAGTDHLYPGGVGGCDPLGQAFPGRKELDVQQVGTAGSTDGCAKSRVLVGGQGRFAALGLGAEGDEQQLLAQRSSQPAQAAAQRVGVQCVGEPVGPPFHTIGGNCGKRSGFLQDGGFGAPIIRAITGILSSININRCVLSHRFIVIAVII